MYDGKYDVHSTVIEDENVENHEPMRTHLIVYSEKHPDGHGKIYEMEIYAYLLYMHKETYQGISLIKI